MKHNINIAVSPNSSFKDAWIALKQLCIPWNWQYFTRGAALNKLEAHFKAFFGFSHVYSMNSGREALYLILKSLNFNKGDEIILQSFTCKVVENSITWNALKPVYVDMDSDTYNLDPKKIEKAITKHTRAIMVQHTFGIPADIQKIKKICEKHNLLLIEDCAHAMGAQFSDGAWVGTVGDISFFSMGRSKVISCVSGGVIATNKADFSELIKKNVQECGFPKITTIIKNLLHPIVFSIVKPLYNKGPLGRGIIVCARKVRMLTMEVESHEKRGEFQKPYPKKLPNALAGMALQQFKSLHEFNTQRRKSAQVYYDELTSHKDLTILNPSELSGAIFLRYPVICKDKEQRDAILRKGKKRGINLGDWYSVPIAPASVDAKSTYYRATTNPNVENICDRVLNLPTHKGIRRNDIHNVLKLFTSTLS